MTGVNGDPARAPAPRSDTAPLRGLVIDWGGVLTASVDGAFSDWALRDGVDYEHFRDVMRAWVGPPRGGRTAADPMTGPVADLERADDAGPAGTSPVHRLERGEIGVEDFERDVAAALAARGSAVSAPGLLGRMLDGLGPLDPAMLDLVRSVRRAGVRTALLSNSWGNAYPEHLWAGLFDVVVISGRVGMRKPEERIYRHTVDLLGLPAHECVMVDDLPHNIAGAVAAGLVGVLHTDPDSTTAELEVLLRLPPRSAASG